MHSSFPGNDCTVIVEAIQHEEGSAIYLVLLLLFRFIKCYLLLCGGEMLHFGFVLGGSKSGLAIGGLL